MKKILFLVSMISMSIFAHAQLADSLKAQLIKDWERAKLYTKEYLDAMPADKYSFKAQDSIRSFAQQMLHLAQGNVGLSANGTGKERIWPGSLEERKSAQSPDSVRYFVMASYDYAIDGIKALDPSRFLETTGRGNFMFTRLAWLMKAFEHQTHHRGQTTIYIRLVGIKPPNEKLF